VPPSLAAAEGYTAGLVLAAAVRSAGSVAQEAVRGALAELELSTPLGEYRVSPESGAQLGFKPLLVQIRKGRPELGAPLLPYPQWNERALIK
jgi:branched-chain amino acid transport system substrate-binding protein